MTTRRTFLTGLTTIIAAPAIVRASSLMPVKAWSETSLVAPGLNLRGIIAESCGFARGDFVYDPETGISWIVTATTDECRARSRDGALDTRRMLRPVQVSGALLTEF